MKDRLWRVWATSSQVERMLWLSEKSTVKEMMLNATGEEDEQEMKVFGPSLAELYHVLANRVCYLFVVRQMMKYW